MTILDKINADKLKEVETAKSLRTIKELEKYEFFNRKTYSAVEFVRRKDKSGIIAEFKRKSPSKGIINDKVSVEEVTTGYAAVGASVLSVLTNTPYFGGTNDDLIVARKQNQIPILRKDFILDEYQIVEAKALGADLILLIAASLTKQQVSNLARCARSLGLEVLMEVHTKEELDKCVPELNLVGVNNRNLKDFTVDIQHSIDLFEYIPSEFVKVSESGIGDPKNVIKLKEHGYEAFLMGEAFMKTNNPAAACAEYIKEAKLNSNI